MISTAAADMAASLSNPLEGYKLPPQPALPHPTNSPFPYATAPDIIRAHQKDAYFQGHLGQSLSDVHRRLLGARSAHAWAAETKTAAALVYYGLTTLLGHQTLGEEYSDILQVHPISSAPSPKHLNKGALATKTLPPGSIQTPSLLRRAAYILGSIILPYLLSRSLPKLRGRIRQFLERYLSRARSQTPSHRHPSSGLGGKKQQKPSIPQRIASHTLSHLPSLTDPTHVHALSLALFYFTGSYYELSKRISSLRYVFARVPPELTAAAAAAAASPSDQILTGQRGGYEVLGVLLALQLAVQGYRHVADVFAKPTPSPEADGDDEEPELAGTGGGRINPRDRSSQSLHSALSTNEDSFAGNNSLLPSSSSLSSSSTARISRLTSTPLPPRASGAWLDLEAQPKALGWLKGPSARKCTLCLEGMKDPALTGCGHLFCWVCICDWVREKPECPLCRRGVGVEKILPLRGV